VRRKTLEKVDMVLAPTGRCTEAKGWQLAEMAVLSSEGGAHIVKNS
jgi:hypothetical protein